MLPGHDDRHSRDHDAEHEDDFDRAEPRGWSKPEIPRSERETPWGIENAIPVSPQTSVHQNPKEHWGGRAGSHGDDTEAEPPVAKVPPP